MTGHGIAAQVASGDAAPALLIEALSKTYAGMKALDDVSMSVRAGEIHALVGHNGSGKSTLIKALSGYHLPDEGGRVFVAGQALAFGDAQASRDAGLRFVHQDLGLIDSLTVAENIALTIGFKVARGRILWSAENERAASLLALMESAVQPTALVADLGPAERTEVAIARALATIDAPARVIVLDEPTANIAASETERLFRALRALRAQGVGIVFVSHMIDEIMSLCDRASVLREGRKVGTFDVAALTAAQLVEHIVGGALVGSHRGSAQEFSGAQPLLTVENLNGFDVDDISFAVRPGEVLGIAGLTGSGREDIANLVFGALPRRGTVCVQGQVIEPFSPGAAIANGIALLPSERARRAIIPTMTLRENITLPRFTDILRRGRILGKEETSDVRRWLSKLNVRPANPEALPASLSGGNQQRVVLAKCLRLKPKILVLDEPTQGVDVGAKTYIYDMITAAARSGTAVLVCSSDSEELATLADRVLIMNRGRVAHELEGKHVDRKTIDRLELAGNETERLSA